jgi:hypothetical protein
MAANTIARILMSRRRDCRHAGMLPRDIRASISRGRLTEAVGRMEEENGHEKHKTRKNAAGKH